jgi:hypothetical protein
MGSSAFHSSRPCGDVRLSTTIAGTPQNSELDVSHKGLDLTAQFHATACWPVLPDVQLKPTMVPAPLMPYAALTHPGSELNAPRSTMLDPLRREKPCDALLALLLPRWTVRRASLGLGIGLAAGVLLGLIAMRAVSAMLYGLTPNDPSTFLMTAALMSVVALIATILPVYRAVNADPMVALREE